MRYSSSYLLASSCYFCYWAKLIWEILFWSSARYDSYYCSFLWNNISVYLVFSLIFWFWICCSFSSKFNRFIYSSQLLNCYSLVFSKVFNFDIYPLYFDTSLLVSLLYFYNLSFKLLSYSSSRCYLLFLSSKDIAIDFTFF